MLGDGSVSATIGVKDMKAANDFYEGVLGLTKADESAGGTYYKSGSTGIFVYPTQFAGTNKATYAAWLVQDVDETAKNLKDKGVQFEQYDNMPGMTREGDIHIMGDLRAAWFTDPDGNILNIVNRMG